MTEFINLAILAAFIPTFFFVSITPGLCMTLAMTMGMAIGFRKTLWMMLGELAGVAVVAIAAVIGVAAIMLKYPLFFSIMKYAGGLYLAYVGINMWLSRGKMAINLEPQKHKTPTRISLISQGFVTAIANPKGWAFFISLLPPFIDASKALVPQLSLLILIILILEFLCLCLYCLGGNTLRKFLQQSANVRLLNRIAGTLMIGVAVWLVIG